MDDPKVFADVLKSGDTLERLYITGGEPLINDRVADILDYLVDTGASRHIHLELSTNCTHVSTESHRAAQKVSQSRAPTQPGRRRHDIRIHPASSALDRRQRQRAQIQESMV